MNEVTNRVCIPLKQHFAEFCLVFSIEILRHSPIIHVSRFYDVVFANCAIVRCSTKRRFLTPLCELLQLDILNVVRVLIEFSRKKGGGDNGEKTLAAPVLHRLSFRPKSSATSRRRRVFIVGPPPPVGVQRR